MRITKESRQDVRLRLYHKGDNGPFTNYAPWGGQQSLLPAPYVNRRVHDRQVPGWRRRIKERELASTYLHGTRFSASGSKPGSAHRELRSSDGTASYLVDSWGFMAPAMTLGVPNSALVAKITSQADTQAIVDFVKRARKAQTAFQGAVSLGELGETLRMLRNPAREIFRGIRDYVQTSRRRLPRRFGQSPRVSNRIVQDTWLEYSFGWKPFVSDVEDACKALRRQQELLNNPPRKWIKSLRQSEAMHCGIVEDTAHEVTHPSGLLIWDHRSLTRYWVTIQYMAFVGLDLNALGARSLSENFGFKPQEFIPTIWELIPYSFLVDYFSNIGEILSSLSFNRAACGKIWRTYRYGIDAEGYDFKLRRYSGGAKMITESFVPGSVKLSQRSITRDEYLGSLVPSLEFTIPGLSTKWLNIAALGRMRRA